MKRNDVIAGFIGLFCFGVSYLFQVQIKPLVSAPLVLVLCEMLISMAIVLFTVILVKKEILKKILPTPSRSIMVMIAGILLLYLVVSCCFFGRSAADALILFVLQLIFVALMEEFVYRGVLFELLSSAHSRLFSFVITNVLFAFTHFFCTSEDLFPLLFLLALFVGMTSSMLYILGFGLYHCMLFHFLANIHIVLAILFYFPFLFYRLQKRVFR